MKKFRICITRYGYATVEAETEDTAFEAAKNLDEGDFDWESVNSDILEDAKVIDVFDDCVGAATTNAASETAKTEASAPADSDDANSALIPATAKSIDGRTFMNRGTVTSVTIPSGVTRIGVNTFNSCPNLTAINVDAENPVFKSIDGVLFSKDGKKLIQCPAGRTGAYDVPSGVTSIGNSAFWGCAGLTAIAIPNGVENIGNSAFWGCAGLKSVVIPSGVTKIGQGAFESCGNLTNITIPEGVTTAKDYAFSRCRGLTDITIPDGVTGIKWAAFFSCTGLTSVHIPKSVSHIWYSAFEGCGKLAHIHFAGTKAQWNAIAKNSSWNYRTGDYAVHCTDGDMPKA